MLEINRSVTRIHKVSLNNFDTDTDIWEELGGDRPSCRSLVAKRAISYEKVV